MSLRRPTVAFLLKALYVVSLRCPTVASFSLFLFVHLSRRRFRHPIGSYLCSVGISGGLPPFPFYLPRYANYWMYIGELIMTHSCMHLLYLMSKLSCEYIQSTHLACWFGQMLTKAILWMKSSIASRTPRGVPVSPVRSCFGHCIIRFRNPRINSSSLPRRSMSCQFRSQIIHHHFYLELVACHHTPVS